MKLYCFTLWLVLRLLPPCRSVDASDIVDHFVTCSEECFAMDDEIEIQFQAMVRNGSRSSRAKMFKNDPYKGSALPRRMVDPVLMESPDWAWTRCRAPPSGLRWQGKPPGKIILWSRWRQHNDMQELRHVISIFCLQDGKCILAAVSCPSPASVATFDGQAVRGKPPWTTAFS